MRPYHTGRLHAIAVSKQLNGHVLVVKKVRTGRKTLAVKSMRKYKGGGSNGGGGEVPGGQMLPKELPTPTSGTTPATEI